MKKRSSKSYHMRKVHKKDEQSVVSKKQRKQKTSTNIVKIFQCTICDKKYRGNGDLKIHIREKHLYTVSKCNLCEFETTRVKGLTQHMKRRHGEKIFISCDMCSFQTTENKAIEKHKIRRHGIGKPKPLTCEMCGFESKDKNLKRHKMRFHGKKGKLDLISCESCAYQSRYTGHMNRHKKSKHQT